ncbi:inositol hexakisphosphate kinase 2-like isoform X1 [Etheostoma cragini]|uniref:inositol hexakisphosphate kinase 2-like isoform X1 n=2 Tax=Etheostoma cragini TaxID=417921 RepID=UPI00155DFC74|nr:inositol hexakisphosphate kinase 2-like isoform X1 [Etheostoma cragini]
MSTHVSPWTPPKSVQWCGQGERMGPAVEAQSQKAMDLEQKQQQQQQQQQKLQHQQCYMEKGVMLEPFLHQVGGHCCVLSLGEQTICKPLIPREHQFYKCVPASMRKFIPQYRGVVSVSFEEDEEGNLCLTAYPLQSDPAVDLMWEKKMASSPLVDGKNHSKDGQSHHSCKDKDKSDQKLEEEAEVFYYRLERSHSNAVPQLKQKPWTVTLQQQHLQKLKEEAMHCNQYKFILLENLTWRHTLPCVLDVKMGTQQYGDEVTEEKKARKKRKCENSTAPVIGVCLSGMQVYQYDTGQLMFMNKFHGRRLTVPDFKEALFQFFHSGQRLRRELFAPVLQRLQEVQAALEACESYRFYSSSLLIIYDGAPHQKGTEDDLSVEEEDEEVEAEPEMEEEDEEEVGEEAGALGFSRRPSTSSDGSTSGGISGVSQARLSSSDPRSPLVDVRMIDFAHTTCRHYEGDSVVYKGLDSGYIFGLQNLITIISELENHSTD